MNIATARARARGCAAKLSVRVRVAMNVSEPADVSARSARRARVCVHAYAGIISRLPMLDADNTALRGQHTRSNRYLDPLVTPTAGTAWRDNLRFSPFPAAPFPSISRSFLLIFLSCFPARPDSLFMARGEAFEPLDTIRSKPS